MSAYDAMMGKWVFLHGGARLHQRGRLVGIEQGVTATRLLLHPSFTVYDWNAERTQIAAERLDRTTEAEPAIVIAEHFTRCQLQPEAWPTDEAATPARRKR